LSFVKILYSFGSILRVVSNVGFRFENSFTARF
jgi:hypothetical protein